MDSKIGPWLWLDREKAKKGLEDISEFLTKNHVEYWLQFGTLLGALREGTFIVHDVDVDIGIEYEGYKKILSLRSELQNTYNILIGPQIFYPSNVVKMICMSIYNVKFDFYVFYIKDGFSRYINNKQDKWQTWESPSNFHAKLGKINFLGKDYPCPSDAEQYIEFIYGKDWRTPQFGSIHPSYVKYYDDIASIIPENMLIEMTRK